MQVNWKASFDNHKPYSISKCITFTSLIIVRTVIGHFFFFLSLVFLTFFLSWNHLVSFVLTFFSFVVIFLFSHSWFFFRFLFVIFNRCIFIQLEITLMKTNCPNRIRSPFNQNGPWNITSIIRTKNLIYVIWLCNFIYSKNLCSSLNKGYFDLTITTYLLICRLSKLEIVKLTSFLLSTHCIQRCTRNKNKLRRMRFAIVGHMTNLSNIRTKFGCIAC